MHLRIQLKSCVNEISNYLVVNLIFMYISFKDVLCCRAKRGVTPYKLLTTNSET